MFTLHISVTYCSNFDVVSSKAFLNNKRFTIVNPQLTDALVKYNVKKNKIYFFKTAKEGLVNYFLRLCGVISITVRDDDVMSDSHGPKNIG